jgi:excisionase family DNA binding protein
MAIYLAFLPGREPSLVRVQQAAKKLECDERTIRRWIRAQVLRAERVGSRAWGVYKADVESLSSRRGSSC